MAMRPITALIVQPEVDRAGFKEGAKLWGIVPCKGSLAFHLAIGSSRNAVPLSRLVLRSIRVTWQLSWIEKCCKSAVYHY